MRGDKLREGIIKDERTINERREPRRGVIRGGEERNQEKRREERRRELESGEERNPQLHCDAESN